MSGNKGGGIGCQKVIVCVSIDSTLVGRRKGVIIRVIGEFGFLAIVLATILLVALASAQDSRRRQSPVLHHGPPMGVIPGKHADDGGSVQGHPSTQALEGTKANSQIVVIGTVILGCKHDFQSVVGKDFFGKGLGLKTIQLAGPLIIGLRIENVGFAAAKGPCIVVTASIINISGLLRVVYKFVFVGSNLVESVPELQAGRIDSGLIDGDRNRAPLVRCCGIWCCSIGCCYFW